jgi:hypothetical protein
MTTIAWDGKTLATDRMASHGGSRRFVRKLFDCGEWMYGGTGNFDEVHLIAEWLTGGAKTSERVTLDESNHCGIAVRKDDGRAFSVEGKRVLFVAIRGERFATGSGHEYAMAAMTLGKTAAQAVAFAARFDLYTGLGVDTWRFKAGVGRGKR